MDHSFQKYLNPSMQIPFSGVLLLLVISWLIGVCEKNIITRKIRSFMESNSKLRFLVTLYCAFMDIIKSIMHVKDNNTKVKSALFSYPYLESKSFGFQTADTKDLPREVVEKLPFDNPCAVLSPTSPNPITGMVALIDKKNVILQDHMETGEMFALLTSCGLSAEKAEVRHDINTSSSRAMRLCKSLAGRILSGMTTMIVIWIFYQIYLLLQGAVVFVFHAITDITANAFMSFSLVVTVIFVTGILFNFIIVKKVFNVFSSMLSKIPLISILYKTSVSITKLLNTEKKENYSSGCLIRYPSQNVYMVGIMTMDNSNILEGYSHVFVPTTPNPTSGFLVMVKNTDVIILDATISQCTQWVLSCFIDSSDNADNADNADQDNNHAEQSNDNVSK